MAGAFDEDAFDVGAFDEGTTTPYMIRPSAALRGRAALAHTYPFFAGRPFTPAQALQPPRHFFPEPVTARGRAALAHTYPFFATSPGIKITILSGFGDPGAATFVLALETGLKIIYSWSTDIIRSYSGQEQRLSPFGSPRRRLEGVAFLRDASSRDARGALMKSAASGATFLLALPMEELVLVADSSGQTVFVSTTTLSDWIIGGQRVVIISPSGGTVTGVVQSSTATTIKLDITPGAVGKRGGRILPLLQVLLDAVQGFARYPATVDLWSIRALSNVFGWCGLDQMGLGATITTFTSGAPVALSSITELDLLIWDRVNAIEGQASESLMSGADVIDLGALPQGIGTATSPDWSRSIKLRKTPRAEWAWFKAFIRLCRGRQRVFALSTNRPDLVLVVAISGGIKVQSATVAGGGDYVSWFAGAHRRLALTMTSRVIQYVEVTAVLDNLDGTLSLTLDSSLIGTISKISFLETVRFESDDFPVVWQGTSFSVDLVARAVQEQIDTTSQTLFDKVVTVNFSYSGIPPDVPPATQTLFATLGKTTLVNWTSDRTLGFSGIHATGGNVDEMVVCISNVNNNSFAISLEHEVSANATDRLRNSGLASIAGANRSTWYRYNGAIGRWIQLI